MIENNNRHSNDKTPDPRTKMQAKYKNHHLEHLVSKYIETKYQNNIKKTTEQLFDSIKEFLPNMLSFVRGIDKEYKNYEKELK